MFARFAEVVDNPYELVRESGRALGKKVIGYGGIHLPAEMIHSAGCLPAMLWRSNEAITLGQAYLQPYFCAIVRSVVDDQMKGKLDFLDGMVFVDQCLPMRGMPYLIKKVGAPAYLEWLNLSGVITAVGIKEQLVEELQRFRAALAAFSGREITDESLNESIRIYNRNRAMMRKLFALRNRRPDLFRARDLVIVAQAGLMMPKEEHTRLLEAVVAKLETSDVVPKKKPKVLLSGHLCMSARFDILDMLDDLGISVVDDDLYVGSRYFANDVAVSDDPIGALADCFLQKSPYCPTKPNADADWADELIAKAKQSGAQGIVTLLARYCSPHQDYYSYVKGRLVGAGIPELLIQVEHETVGLEAIKISLETFVELLWGRA